MRNRRPTAPSTAAARPRVGGTLRRHRRCTEPQRAAPRHAGDPGAPPIALRVAFTAQLWAIGGARARAGMFVPAVTDQFTFSSSCLPCSPLPIGLRAGCCSTCDIPGRKARAHSGARHMCPAYGLQRAALACRGCAVGFREGRVRPLCAATIRDYLNAGWRPHGNSPDARPEVKANRGTRSSGPRGCGHTRPARTLRQWGAGARNPL